jgi:hypothetical protein
VALEEMKMRAIVAIVCLGLLMWVEPAGAQTTHSLAVSHHRNTELSNDDIDTILGDASKVLQKEAGHVDTPNDVACNVTLQRRGAVRTFASRSTPAKINEQADRDAVHRENADIKVVEVINFCKGHGPVAGCTWPPEAHSMIIVRPGRTLPRVFQHLVWAHEFGHRTGLRHRSDPLALMTICPLSPQAANQVQVSRDECNCFLSGPGSCRRQEPANLSCGLSGTLRDIVRSPFIDEVPYAMISRHDPSELPALVSMLHDPTEQNSWANIATVLGLAGDGDTGRILKDFIESDPADVDASSVFRSKAAAVVALGYLLNRNDDPNARAFLLDTAHPYAWQQAGPWIGQTTETRQSRIDGLQDSRLVALALSGRPEAGRVLESLAPSERRGKQLIDDLMQTYFKVKQRGLAAYYGAD